MTVAMASNVEKKNAMKKVRCGFSGIEVPVYISKPNVMGATIIGWSNVDIIEATRVTGN